MNLPELLALHDELCSAKLPIAEWVPRWREYEAARHELLRQGVDLEVEIGKRQGRLLTTDQETVAEKIALLDEEPQADTTQRRKRTFWWQR